MAQDIRLFCIAAEIHVNSVIIDNNVPNRLTCKWTGQDSDIACCNWNAGMLIVGYAN